MRRALRFAADQQPAFVSNFRRIQLAAVLWTREILARGISLLLVALSVVGLGLALDELHMSGLIPDHLYDPALTFVIALPIGAILEAIPGRGANRYGQRPHRQNARPCDGYSVPTSIISHSEPAEQVIGMAPRSSASFNAAGYTGGVVLDCGSSRCGHLRLRYQLVLCTLWADRPRRQNDNHGDYLADRAPDRCHARLGSFPRIRTKRLH